MTASTAPTAHKYRTCLHFSLLPPSSPFPPFPFIHPPFTQHKHTCTCNLRFLIFIFCILTSILFSSRT
ncbi:hypothetical protein RIF29_07521 [Crotalaria pallida]|uniref:Uncharacterized protein n=1 Tax=Crotalaria pallida TaxID=3830 RepID=A0AAN9PAV1_CROPI